MSEETRTEAAPLSCDQCPCPGVWMPIILVPLIGMRHRLSKPKTIEIGMLLCDKHRQELKVSDVLTDDIWDGVEQLINNMGSGFPDRAGSELRFERVSEGPTIH
jgi:hypothetical protein